MTGASQYYSWELYPSPTRPPTSPAGVAVDSSRTIASSDEDESGTYKRCGRSRAGWVGLQEASYCSETRFEESEVFDESKMSGRRKSLVRRAKVDNASRARVPSHRRLVDSSVSGK